MRADCNLMDFECGVKRAITNSDRGQRTHILAELLQNGDDQIRDFSLISLFKYIHLFFSGKSIASKKLESRLIDLGLVTVISLTVISNSRHISFILDVIFTSDIRFRLSAKNFAFLSMNKKTQKLFLCYDHSL